MIDVLFAVGSKLAGIDVASTTTAAQFVLDSLDLDCKWSPQLRSTLNNDGYPLQLCVSSSRSGRTVRLLGDPAGKMDARDYAVGSLRLERERRALWRLLEFANCGSLRSSCDCILQVLVPSDAESPGPVSGVLWLGVGLGCPGIALYVNARRGRVEEQWRRVAECLCVTARSDEAIRAVAALRPHALPASVGIEGTGPHDARVKIYWRLRQATALKQLSCSLFLEPSLAQFLVFLLGSGSIRISGLVFGAGFDIVDGRLRDVKIDVCGHCLQFSAEDWLGVIERVTLANGLTDMRVGSFLRSGVVEVALLGFGVDRLGQRRLNLYLKHPSP